MTGEGNLQRAPEPEPSPEGAPEPPCAEPLEPWTEADAMLPRFGLALKLFAKRYLDRVRVEEDVLESLKGMHKRGTVVYVLPSTSALDTLVLNRIALREGLALARFLGGVSLLLAWPLGRLILHWIRRLFSDDEAAPATHRFEQALRAGGPAVLYAKSPMRMFMGGRGLLRPYLEVLARVQREQQAPIFLVPAFIVWSQRQTRARQSIWDQVFGDPDAPGALRRVANFLRHSRRAFLSVGEVVEVSEFLAGRDPEEEPAVTQEELRTAVQHRFAVERRVITGPTLKPGRQIRQEVERTPEFDAMVFDLAEETGMSAEEVRKEASSSLKEIAADFTMAAIDAFCLFLSFVFQRLYTDLQVDKTSVVRLRDIMRRGPVVLLPCHRSHIDYLVISYVMYTQGLMPPHIAAGKNLSFFPLGYIFRRSGAFFIRRSFRDHPVYARTLRAYVRKLAKEGIPMEFFIEGGRSRTGKCLPPRLGLLKEVLLAHLDGAAPEIFLVPTGLSYEKVIEDAAYERELSGGTKKKETLGALLKTPRVLGSRYGRLTVTFGEPISVARDVEEHSSVQGVPGLDPAEPESFGYFLGRLGYKVLHGVNEVILCTPTALCAWALLAHPGRGVDRETLLLRVGFLAELLAAKGAPLAPTLASAVEEHRDRIAEARAGLEADELGVDASDDQYGEHRPLYEVFAEAFAPVVDETLRMMVDTGYVTAEEFEDTAVYTVPPQHRIAVDYYKNTIFHALLRECLLATVLLRSMEPDGTVPVAAAREDCSILSRVFKYEFIFDPDLGFEQAFKQTWGEFVEYGWLDDRGEVAHLPEARRPLLEFLRHGLLPCVEAYALVCERARALERPQTEPDFILSVVRNAEKKHATGELWAREAGSTALLSNAVKAMGSMGILVRRREGRKMHVEVVGPEAAAAMENLEAHLRRWAKKWGQVSTFDT